MARLTYMERMGVRKGPWSPEEDIKLVSYIQEHGPGNWKVVPIYTGLRRCSKSCRLRWRNYLRPGIKRGNFTPEEEKKITDLQSLFGNRWAAIATYFPRRTDNDIKNYWNSHLKKKREVATGSSIRTSGDSGSDSSSNRRAKRSTGVWERRLQTNVQMTRLALSQALAISPSASSTAAASLPQAGFGSTLMATPPVPSSASGTKSTPNDFSNRLIRDHRLNIGPEEIQASLTTSATTDHVFSADNIARMLDNWTTKPVRAVSEQEINNSAPVVAVAAVAGSNVGSLYFANTATFSDVITVNHPNFEVNLNMNSASPVMNSSVTAPLNQHQRINIDVNDADIPSFADIEHLLLDDPSAPLSPVAPPASTPVAYNSFGHVY